MSEKNAEFVAELERESARAIASGDRMTANALAAMAETLARKCDGSCAEHRGEVRDVSVQGWGDFRYCEEAIDEDRRRGLNVEPKA